MNTPNKICIHLFSDLFPCPWLDHPQLERARKWLQSDIKRIRTTIANCSTEVSTETLSPLATLYGQVRVCHSYKACVVC